MEHSHKLVSIRGIAATITVSFAFAFVFLGLAISAGCSAGGGGGGGGAGTAPAGETTGSSPTQVSSSGSGTSAPAANPTTSQQSPTNSPGNSQQSSSGGTSTSSSTPSQPTSTTSPPLPSPTPSLNPASAGSAAALVLVSGNSQTGTTGAPLPLPLTVRVQDASGVNVPGVGVAFAITSGGGTLSAASATTDDQGLAASALSSGSLEGTTTVRVSVVGVASATFTEICHLAPAQHADYYVATNAAGAFDSNDGLSPTEVSGTRGPWLTIGHAAQIAKAGDIVHVSGGTYSEDVTLPNDGSATAPVQFAATMDQAVVVSSIRINGRHYVQVRGFVVIGPKTLPATWVDMPQVLVDDPTVGWIDPSVSWTAGRQALVNRKYATYVASFAAFNGPNYSLFTAGIWISASSDVIVSNNTVSLHTIGIDCDTASTRLTVQDNTCFHCRDGIWSYASTGASFTDSLIDGNHCLQNLSTGISAASGAQNVTVSNNLCEYNAIHQFAVSSLSTLCTVRHNVAQYGGYYSETMQSPGSSGYAFYDVGPGNVADGNVASYQHDPTFNDGNGFIVDTSSSPVTLVNNVAYRNQGTGITLTLTSSNTVVNNTLVENGYQSTSAFNGAGLRFSATSSTGNTVANNCFSANRVCGIHGAGVLSAQSVNFNLYAPGSPAIHDSYDSTHVYVTVTNVRQATGQEENGVSADPLFAHPTVADFHLGSGSPAIGAGRASLAPPVDLDGTARHAPPDMGAFEHP